MTTPIGIPARTGLRLSGVLVAALAALIALVVSMRSAPQAAAGAPPPDLRDTGLYSDVETLQIDARHLAFSPQYPLWTDGADEAALDLVAARQRDRRFRSGRVGFSGRDAALEGVLLRRASASRRASWSGRRTASGSMRPMRGARTGAARSSCRSAAGAAPIRSAAGRSHTIPGVNDCKACHQGGRSEVLGFGLIQLVAGSRSGRAARGPFRR